MERKVRRSEEELSDKEYVGANSGSGGARINDGMSANGMEADVPLSKRT
jgi:hypothetical protein